MTVSVEELRKLQSRGIAFNELGRERLRAHDEIAEAEAEDFVATQREATRTYNQVHKRLESEYETAIAAHTAAVEAIEQLVATRVEYEQAWRTLRALDLPFPVRVERFSTRAVDDYATRTLMQRARTALNSDW